MKQYYKYYRLIFTYATIIIAIFCISDGFNFYANALNASALSFGINANEVVGNKFVKVFKVNAMIKERKSELQDRVDFLVEKSLDLGIDVSSILSEDLTTIQLVEKLEVVLNEKPINYDVSKIPSLCFESVDLATQYATIEIERYKDGMGDLQVYKEQGINIVNYEIESCSYIEDTSMYVSAYELSWIDDKYERYPIID